MNKKILIIILIVFATSLIISLFNTPPTKAAGIGENIAENITETGGTAYYDDVNKTPITDPAIIVGKIIQIALGFIGILFTILILISGFQWMTAGGNTDTIKKAQQRITNAVIGLVIALAVFGLTTFIINKAFLITGV